MCTINTYCFLSWVENKSVDMSLIKILKEDYLMGLFGGFGGRNGNDCCDIIMILFLLNQCGCGCNINLDCDTLILLLLFSTLCGSEKGMGGCGNPCR